MGALPGLTSKRPKAGNDLKNQSQRELLKYVHFDGKAKGSTGQVLLQLLKMCLDNILFRLGMASTIPGDRKLVNNIHILVNGHIIDIPIYR
ncbi:hypothetical protein MKX03_033640 [Papaver bracteatum]|nr:hypothetical protein MKX03_033640 [Papaver bracteatum]